MRTLKKISLAFVLTLALSTCAMAGITECPPGASPPAPEPATSTGITETPPAAQSEPIDPVIKFALDVLQSVLF